MVNRNVAVITPQEENIRRQIYIVRDVQIMIDHDLAALFGVETKAINQAAKRNLSRFPAEFRFQLTENEKNGLVTSCDRFKSLKHSSTLPYVFTEQGVAMLSAVLRSRTAIEISISIINAFVAMRRFLVAHEPLLQRLDTLEKRQLGHEMKTDARFEQVFAALDAKRQQPEQGVFFDGQVFDAYRFVSDLLRQAQKSIVLIDNYVDDSVLALLAKRQTGVSAIVLTRSISKTLALDLEKHNAQYPPVAIREFADSHDRFLILDGNVVYHLGASLKDLGKKWFAFAKMDGGALSVMERVADILEKSHA